MREWKYALHYDPKDQIALYCLIMVLRKRDGKGEIPALLKRLALLRQEATRRGGEDNRYKLIIKTDVSMSTGEFENQN
jgi:hypothetical protein